MKFLSFETTAKKSKPEELAEKVEGVTEDTEEFAELDLSQTEDLKKFLENADNIYAETMRYAAAGETDKYKKLGLDYENDEDFFAQVTKDFGALENLINQVFENETIEIDSEKVQELYDKLLERRDLVCDAYDLSKDYVISEDPLTEPVSLVDRRRKQMELSDESNEGKIKISVADEAAKAIQRKTAPKMSFVPKSVKAGNRASLAAAERKDPLNKIVRSSSSRPSNFESLSQDGSLTVKFLSNPVYRQFIEKNYGSPANFDREIIRVINSINQKTIDPYERWLKVEHSDVFDYLSDRTLAEIGELSASSETRNILQQENIKYEAFVYWLDRLAEMLDVVETTSETTFAEVVTKWVAETAMIDRTDSETRKVAA